MSQASTGFAAAAMLNFIKILYYNMKNNHIMFVVFVILILIYINCSNAEGFGIIGKTPNYKINNVQVKDKYNSLVSILGNPIYLEIDGNSNINSATWMSPLNKFNGFGKYGGADYIKILGNPSKKYHPHPASLFVIIGKYMNVPDNLIGALKYASETINIEQLIVPKKYSEKYFNTGEKEIALVTGSCASVTISAITIQFVIDMIYKYKKYNLSQINKSIYNIFRNEYDTRINNYLCGSGITHKMKWFDHTFFHEPARNYIGKEKCGELFTDYMVGEGAYDEDQSDYTIETMTEEDKKAA